MEPETRIPLFGGTSCARRLIFSPPISMVSMSGSPSSEPITALLSAAAEGDAGARERLWERVYPNLREIAHREMGRERSGQTLQTTSLVNEAYLRLVDQTEAGWKDRVHFFAVSATVMRHVLIDFARSRNRKKRGGAQKPLELDEELLGGEVPGSGSGTGFSEELLDLGAALDRLAAFDERGARVVDCRFFAGLSVDETAEALGVSPRTVKSDWAGARAWLLRELQE